MRKIKRIKSVLLAWLVVVALAIIVFQVSKPLYQSQLAAHSLLTTPPLSKLKSDFINLMTLGHRSFYDNFVTFWTIQILQDDSLKSYPPSKVIHTVTSTLQVLPQNEYIYLLTCFVFSYDLKSPHACEEVVLLGMKALPRSWRIPLVQAYIYTSLIPNQYKRALYYGITASKPGAPDYIKRLAKRMLQEEELTGVDLDILEQELLRNERGESILGSPQSR